MATQYQSTIINYLVRASLILRYVDLTWTTTVSSATLYLPVSIPQSKLTRAPTTEQLLPETCLLAHCEETYNRHVVLL